MIFCRKKIGIQSWPSVPDSFLRGILFSENKLIVSTADYTITKESDKYARIFPRDGHKDEIEQLILMLIGDEKVQMYLSDPGERDGHPVLTFAYDVPKHELYKETTSIPVRSLRDSS